MKEGEAHGCLRAPGARERRDVHRQRFRQRRLEQRWLLLPPGWPGARLPGLPHLPALCGEQSRWGERKKRVVAFESKSLGVRRVEGAGFEGSGSPDTSSPSSRLCEHAGASLGVPGAWKCSSPSILHEAGAGTPAAFPSRSHPRTKLAAAWSHGLAAPADPRGQRFTMNF